MWLWLFYRLDTRVHARACLLVLEGRAKCGISLDHFHQCFQLRPFAYDCLTGRLHSNAKPTCVGQYSQRRNGADGRSFELIELVELLLDCIGLGLEIELGVTS